MSLSAASPYVHNAQPPLSAKATTATLGRVARHTSRCPSPREDRTALPLQHRNTRYRRRLADYMQSDSGSHHLRRGAARRVNQIVTYVQVSLSEASPWYHDAQPPLSAQATTGNPGHSGQGIRRGAPEIHDAQPPLSAQATTGNTGQSGRGIRRGVPLRMKTSASASLRRARDAHVSRLLQFEFPWHSMVMHPVSQQCRHDLEPGMLTMESTMGSTSRRERDVV